MTTYFIWSSFPLLNISTTAPPRPQQHMFFRGLAPPNAFRGFNEFKTFTPIVLDEKTMQFYVDFLPLIDNVWYN